MSVAVIHEVARPKFAASGCVPHVFPFAAPATLPPGGVLDMPVLVFGITAPIRKLTVSVHIRHEQIGLVALNLQAPDGTGVVLSAFNGGGFASYGASCAEPTVFDDEAADEITQGPPPFAGAFRPQDPLSTYCAKPIEAVNGRWYMIVNDAGLGEARARILCASLTVYL